MNNTQPVFTEKNNCQDCYKCIRHCPVKAIRIENMSASVMDELCIYCGTCVEVCPADAKKVRNDLNSARYLMRNKKKVILSIAPSWPLAFSDYSDTQLLNAFKQLGFYTVSETAVGAEWVTQKTTQILQESQQGLWLSSCCPVIVQMIKKFYPQHIPYLMALQSPMQAHARYLKQIHGEDTAVVFAGPCIAKKKEIEEVKNSMDVVLTFDALRSWLDEEALNPENVIEPVEVPHKNNKNRKSSLYPIDGGMIAGIQSGNNFIEQEMMTFSGIEHVSNILENLDELKGQKLFLELMACEGGCINGPGNKIKTNTAAARLKIIKRSHILSEEILPKHPDLDIHRNFYRSDNASIKKEYSEVEIRDALTTVDKLSSEDELNCGGCGYLNCRDFACAMIEGKAERQMCVSYMRKVAQNQASVLLQKIPYGVVTIDETLHIIESNEHFAKMMGEEAENIFKVKPGMQGCNLKKLLPFSTLFEGLMLSGEESLSKDILFKDELYHLSIFSIQKHKIVCGIFHRIGNNQSLTQEMNDRIYQAIYENMMTAQKVAALLGQNASKTEFLLHSVLEASKKRNEHEE